MVIPVRAQETAQGVIAGRVVDPGAVGLSGVVVTVKSPSGDVVRQTATEPDGTYIVGALPAGEYTLTFELTGFLQQSHTVRVPPMGTATLNVAMALAGVSTSITVRGNPLSDEPEELGPGGMVFRAASLDLLPQTRSGTAQLTMAPGVVANGPNGAIVMSGALSYGNLFLLDGLVINENVRGQGRSFLIQDAMQETRVATGGVSAEYGRFQGGVVNTISKSGTNIVSGSIRVGFSNDSWRALTPYRGDATVNHRAPSLQVTVGGPARKNRLWYFAAAEFEKIEQNRTLPYTRVNYTSSETRQRLEGKLTWAVTPRQSARMAVYRIGASQANANEGAVMDTSSLYDSTSPELLAGGTYAAALGRGWLFDGQYSNRQLTFEGVGAQLTGLTNGTPIWDRSRSDARFNSPAGCAACAGSDDERDNQNALAHLTYQLAGRRTGSHELTVGLDAFQESRTTNSYQSGSGYRVRATRSVVAGENIYPVFLADRTTWVYWMPVQQSAIGNDLRTYSGFVGDAWRATPQLVVNAGLRYDHNSDRDSGGAAVVHNSQLSPRAGVVWAITQDGRYVLNAGVARYVTSINTNIADLAASAGRPATYIYDYLGPAVNAVAAAPQVTSAAALKILFDWYNANGGTSRSPRSAPNIPGLTTRIDPGVKPPDAHEATLGITVALGHRGSARVDGIYRTFGDFYAQQRDTTTGKVTDSSGRKYDLLVVNNSNDVTRVYKGLNAQLSLRIASRGRLWATYTLSSARGNYDGETTNIGPDTAAYTDYPEYRDPAWSSPEGWLAIDQRHKLRATASWDLALPPSLGRFTVGAVQRFDTGRPWSEVGNINPTAYVVNPGYVTPPTSVPYYFSARGAHRTDTIASTDLSLNWYWRPPGAKKTQVFGRAFLTNLFNNAGVTNLSRTVLTRNDSTAYQPFNPFSQVPVTGVHYGIAADFGKPRSPSDYQAPREFTFSLGLRF